MRILPAIDLHRGAVVRLQQGDFERETRYPEDPVELARRYEDAGARILHVVDLDAARGSDGTNLAAIGEICRAVSIPVQTGGGGRSLASIRARLDAGAARVVVGSACVRKPERFCRWLESFGPERLVAGLDVASSPGGGWIPRTAGWTREASQDLFSLLAQFSAAGLKHLLCTDIERDGMLTGPSIQLYQDLCSRYGSIELQASGGVGRESHLEDLSRTGATWCIVGRALLEGKLPLTAIGRHFGNTSSAPLSP